MTVDTPTRADKKQQTRILLIETALDLMAERGIAATRTIDVAERAGVAHGTVFVHFATRDDLVTAVVGEHADQIAGRLHELAGDGATVKDVLAAHLAGLAEHEAFHSRLVMEGPLLPPIRPCHPPRHSIGDLRPPGAGGGAGDGDRHDPDACPSP